MTPLIILLKNDLQMQAVINLWTALSQIRQRSWIEPFKAGRVACETVRNSCFTAAQSVQLVMHYVFLTAV